MKNQSLIANLVILAAGRSSRLNFAKSKPFHKIGNLTIIERILQSCQNIANRIMIVHSPQDLRDFQSLDLTTIASRIEWVKQEIPLGTGDALRQTLPYLEKEGSTIVISGDIPLIKRETLVDLARLPTSTITVVTAEVKRPKGYGRIIRDKEGCISSIQEERDLTPDLEGIKEINSGVYRFSNQFLIDNIHKIGRQNNQKEFYLTDLIGLASRDRYKISCQRVSDEREIKGVNTLRELEEAERIFQKSQARGLLDRGLYIEDVTNFNLRGEIRFGKDNYIGLGVILAGRISLGESCVIEPYAYLRDVELGNNVIIKSNSYIEETRIADDCQIGPFAHLRPGTDLKKGVKIGNYVETKATTMKENSKAMHLSYLGNSEIGEKTNIGGGVIICNYDGKRKKETKIGSNCFIGGNCTLIAPLKIGHGSKTGAGSVITKEIGNRELAIARCKQENLEQGT